MRKCVERAMWNCPNDDMGYFIDAANVFAEYKISRDPCTLAAPEHLVSMVTLTSMALISLAFKALF